MEYQGDFHIRTRSVIATQLCRFLQSFIGEKIKRYKQEVDLFKMNSPFSNKHKLHRFDFESSEIRSQDGTRLFTISPHDVQHISIIPFLSDGTWLAAFRFACPYPLYASYRRNITVGSESWILESENVVATFNGFWKKKLEGSFFNHQCTDSGVDVYDPPSRRTKWWH